MKQILSAFGGCVLLLAQPLMPTKTHAALQEEKIARTNLKVGDTAPDFTLLSDKWKNITLSEYRGKKNVILAFYVLAFTGG